MAISSQTSLSGTPRENVSSGRNQRSRHKGWTWQNTATALMLICLVYFLVPFAWLIVSSTKTNADLFTTFGLGFASTFNLFTNLRDLFTHDQGVFLTWMWNT